MKDGSLLFNIKGDMKHFKKCTKGTICISGRRTFDSITSMLGRPLPERINVVLSMNTNYEKKFDEFVFHDIESILKGIKTMNENDKDISVIGGGKVYSELLPFVDEVILTHVAQDVEEAEIFYPISLQNKLGFKPIHEEEHFDEESNLAYKFITYKK